MAAKFCNQLDIVMAGRLLSAVSLHVARTLFAPFPLSYRAN